MANVKKGQGPTTPVTVLFYAQDLERIKRILSHMGPHSSKGDAVRLCIKMIDDQLKKKASNDTSAE
jgi:hypothetical protein